jgi:hypothetical protein
MRNHEDSQDARQGADTETGVREKKPYRKPAFRHERVFETRALICGKIHGQSQTCNASSKTS